MMSKGCFNNAFPAGSPGGGGADSTKLPLTGGTLSGALLFSGTGHAGLRVNSLTTTQRNALTPASGDLLFNSTLSQFQGYVSGAWASLATLGANTFTGAQNITDTTASTSSTTGALKVAGGLGVAGKVCAAAFAKEDGTVFFNGYGIILNGANASLSSTSGNICLGNAHNSYLATLRENKGIYLVSTGAWGWTDGTSWNGTRDTHLKRGGAAACVQLGEDATGVTNQHLKACNGITSAAAAGAHLTISGGNGRGAAGGDLLFSSYSTEASNTPGVLTNRWKLDASTGALLPAADATYSIGGVGAVCANVYSTDFYSGTNKVVGPQGASVADASGGATVDAEARTAINDLLARIRAHGLIAT